MLSDATHPPYAGPRIGGLGPNVRIYGAHHRFTRRVFDIVLGSLHHLLIFHRRKQFSYVRVPRYSHRCSLRALLPERVKPKSETSRKSNNNNTYKHKTKTTLITTRINRPPAHTQRAPPLPKPLQKGGRRERGGTPRAVGEPMLTRHRSRTPHTRPPL